MEFETRKLPIGIQSFEKIRNGNFLYVDKTAWVFRLVSKAVPYFFSRPRRFGKSLLLSTFEAYFQGKKELFQGLAIGELEKEWLEYPVLHLDLNAEKFDRPERLDGLLNNALSYWEDLYGRRESETSLPLRFHGVIVRAYEKTGRPVVVLVDEYDKPLLQALGDEALSEAYRGTLKSFYGVLKSADAYLKFVFLTGVTKFAHVSIFSDLNQLNDISMTLEYATLCGMTEEELKSVFKPELLKVAALRNSSFDEVVKTLACKYDGYRFHQAGERVFNPFSVLNVLDKGDLKNYWFQTGTPTFLVELLKRSDYDLRRLIEGVDLKAEAFTEYRVESNNPIPVLYQSGYLTIKDFDEEYGNYTLGFPNDEVRYGFLNFVTPFYTTVTDDESGFYIEKFVRELKAGEVDAFLERLKVFFAAFPYELNDRTERHYQVVLYIVFKLMGQYCDVEVRGAKGRADMVVKTKEYIYVFEFKLDGDVEKALRQIDEKGYLLSYVLDSRQAFKVGVSFSAAERNIAEWKVKIV